MHLMSVDWCVYLLGTSMGSFYFCLIFVPGHGGSGRRQGHQNMTKKTQILGVISDPPGIARASLGHRPSNRNNGQKICTQQ